ncbi:methyltransferase domain-containing protein [Spirochaeta isovalerica]|uniref:SAM-dependent methyltransferase n=1 Tax=Spirochaeta isovalerica TaxID=150 RepID=A0A841RFR0_9SPIO|nr:methyltransferase domain-containing protein [Spirochaeta isovalerica]MBB6481192.1 SAM-dependent methyltransferase [Spirochaeta isovalerica]
MYILIPGRHHVVTNFQFQYLYRFIHTQMEAEQDRRGRALPVSEIEGIIFAVTSANHEGTRRNPLSYAHRAMAIQEFSHDLTVPVYCYPITDIGFRSDFASYTIKSILHQADDFFDLSPENCIVACSTDVGDLYEELGYSVFGAERNVAANPWELIERIAAIPHWSSDRIILDEIHPASYRILKQYNLGGRIQFLFSDPIASDDGDITDTRDYASYVRQMDENTHIKWKDVASFVQPGRIGDIGCATGSWLRHATEEPRLNESDFYGVELTRQLHDICIQRKNNGEFANPNIWFARKNAVTGLVFTPGSMNTIHSSSLTHEIESYGSHEELLRFIKNRFDELKPGGIWINRDVVGPEEKDRIVLMKLNRTDHSGDSSLTELSTYERFFRFAMDFRKEEGYSLSWDEVPVGDEDYIKLRYEDAAEFLLTKDYTDNWESEMHERFCFWSYSQWIGALKGAGFEIDSRSKVFTNPWIAENRFKGKVELYREDHEPMDYPPTNFIAVARKPM